MITGYLNQTAIWHYVTGQNEYGEPAFGSKSIKVRWEMARGLVRDNEGQGGYQNAKVLCALNL
jgi:hypothetical protein